MPQTEKKRNRPFRGLRKILTRRLFIVLLILAQIVLLAILLVQTSASRWIGGFLTAVSVVTAFHLLVRHDKNAFKLSLVFLILLFPVFGGAFYWIFHFQTTDIGFRRRLSGVQKTGRAAFRASEETMEEARDALPADERLMLYLQNTASFPVTSGNASRYFRSGKEMFDSLITDLERAERYIFLEYFIIAEGEMWDAVLGILQKKAEAGLDVRVIYDDLGCFMTLPPNYAQKLRAYGIKAHMFNRFRPFLTSTQNNRDHRKIAVIDGRVAYTGGVNLADEYIGSRIRFGNWKDAAIRMEGSAAWSFTVMFLQMWKFLDRSKESAEDFLPVPGAEPAGDEVLQPFCDYPMDAENVSEHVFMHFINRAKKSLYLTTPYLMADESILTAIKLAARSGADVRIITPGVPDKKLVHFTTRSYYRDLIRGGVRIYELTDGFMHAKTMVVDDSAAVVGTANLDYRSLYLHFECGVCLYETGSVRDVRDDFLNTLESCREITAKDCRVNPLLRLLQGVSRVFAPLM